MQLVAPAVTLGGMLAMPFARRGGVVRRILSTIVVGGLFSATTAASSRRWGVPRAAGAVAITTLLTAATERIGTVTGRPFGRYAYTAALQPQVAGVPVVVPMAWLAMAVPARETAHAALGARSNRATRIVAGAAALTAWDLFLDPQMVGEDYWRWARPGHYRGIPVSNYLGWFATGLVVMAVLEAVLPPGEPVPGLVAEYGIMAVMETVGFASFLDDRSVATIGGVGMLPVAALAAARLVGQRS